MDREKEKRMKRYKKAFIIYETELKDQMFILLEFMSAKRAKNLDRNIRKLSKPRKGYKHPGTERSKFITQVQLKQAFTRYYFMIKL